MSPLPANNSAWPPAGHPERYRRMARHAAWYGGDPLLLAAEYGQTGAVIHGGPATTVNPTPGLAKRVIAAVRNEFWATSSTDEVDTKRHLPTPQDIATMSSELLFAEAPAFTIVGPTWPADGPAGTDGLPIYRKGDPTDDTLRTQARLDEILAGCGFQSLLLAAAEISSALGSTGLRIAFDKTGVLKSRAIVARVDADSVVPLYSWGQLVGVMFWQVVTLDKGGIVWRHIELHEGGTVYHGLYRGDGQSIGTRQDLASHSATAHLAPIVNLEGGILIAEGATTAVSIPNVLPDPLDRASNAGRSDYTPAVLDLFDAIDRVYSQMMDTIDDAKSRLIVADSMLERKGAGQGVGFDASQRIFTAVKVPPSEKEGGGLPIEKIQFDMHVAEYLMAIDALYAKVIKAAGYSPQTMGDEGDVAMTATEFAGRTKRSMSTRDKKILYWRPLLAELLTSLVRIDVEQFAPRGADNLPVIAYPVAVSFPDAIQPSLRELSEVAKLLKDAEASSKFERVRLTHPDWSEPQVQAEVDRILAESSVIDPATFGMGGTGLPAGSGI